MTAQLSYSQRSAPTGCSNMKSAREPRWVKLLMPAVALALLGALLMGLPNLALPARAQVEPAGVEELGSVQGQVTDESGAPLAGIQVGFLVKTGSASWSEPVLTAATDAAGQYTARLRAGVYILRFSDPQGVYAQQYYRGAQTLAGAADIVLMGNSVQGANARLRKGGSIAGRVRAPLQNGNQVGAYTLEGGSWQLAAQTGEVDAQGNYQFQGLPEGVYRVCLLQMLDYDNPIRPCYDRISSGLSRATDVTGTSGSAVTGVDIVDVGFRDLAAISGTVTDEQGTPLAGVWAIASARTWMWGWNTAALTQTDAAGVYQLHLPMPASYRIRFENPEGLYIGEEYMDPGDPDLPAVLTLQPYERRDGIDAQLALGGRITGTVSFVGQLPAAGFQVMAFDAAPSPNIFGPGLYDPLTRQYQLGGLPPGAYRVCGLPFGAVGGCYSGNVQYKDAAYVTVTAGSTVPSIDLVLGWTTALTSVLTGAVRGPDGQPLAGIRVDLFFFTPFPFEPQYALLAASTETAADGSYRFEGLADGEYYVRFTDPTGVYAATYYEGSYTPGYAQPILLENGRTTEPIDGRLQPGVAIGGWVQGPDGQGIADAQISAYCRSTSCHAIWDLPTIAYTDYAGRYSLRGLAPGEYNICAQPTVKPLYTVRCYYPLMFAPGEERTNIDIRLGPATLQWLYLPAIGR